jgi:hypothetical protein
MNSNGNFTTSYPQPFFDGYCAQAGPTSIYGTISTNVSKGIADHAVVETVGATSINKYFRKLTDAFLVNGQYFVSWEVLFNAFGDIVLLKDEHNNNVINNEE